MNEKDTGGPAFPVAFTTTPLTGMTLRDWFATFCSEEEIQRRMPMGRMTRAKARYQYADEMLQERAQ